MKGLFTLVKAKLVWMVYSGIMEKGDIKMSGRVVDIETSTCNCDNGTTVTINDPIVEYKSDEGGEMNRRLITYHLFMNMSRNSHILYSPKKLHIGDKVTVICPSDDLNRIFAYPNMPFTRLLCKLFVPGCIYVLAAILGICYVFM